MTVSPMQRSLAKLKADGYHPFITEHYNAFMQRRVDLFGFCDLLALRRDEVLAVQTTTSDNLAARIDKIAEHKNVAIVREAGIRIVCHGWGYSKRDKRWVCREIDIS